MHPIRYDTDTKRRHRKATSAAMKRMVSPCPACERRAVHRKTDVTGCGDLVWSCRYCGHEWTAIPILTLPVSN